MRLNSYCRVLFCLFISALSVALIGCSESKPEAAGPELGAIEAYLNEHPEERIDSDEPQDENEEFEAGS